jgi:hypothetical protein
MHAGGADPPDSERWVRWTIRVSAIAIGIVAIAAACLTLSDGCRVLRDQNHCAGEGLSLAFLGASAAPCEERWVFDHTEPVGSRAEAIAVVAFAVAGFLVAWRPSPPRAALWSALALLYVATSFAAFGFGFVSPSFDHLFDRVIWLPASRVHGVLLSVVLVSLLALLLMTSWTMVRRRSSRRAVV